MLCRHLSSRRVPWRATQVLCSGRCSPSPSAARTPKTIICSYSSDRSRMRQRAAPKPAPSPSPRRRPETMAESRPLGVRPRSPDDFKLTTPHREGFTLDHRIVHRIYSGFLNAASGLHQGQKHWLSEFAKENDIKPQDFYEVALRMADLGPLSQVEHESQSRMLDSASELGHVPATLHIIRTVLYGRSPENLQRSCPRAYARFRTLVAEGRNPDALTLEGKLYALRGERDQAAALFRRAKDVATAAVAHGSTGFQWKNLCQVELAKLQEAVGARQDAYWEYRALADAGDAEACYYLGTLDARMPGTVRLVHEAEARELLTQAAMAGYPAAPTALADLETGMYDQAVADGHKDAAAGHLLDAQEWRNLAAAWKMRDPKNYEVY
ncbi:uncharacterized protein VDAG_10235 [Verticillium dahliae VdLs.17]|uniref:Uncharacterized protein n=2 Tax=Verticillium dahliae TaxID=27337 RepID=G2XJA3_VERDV|nr:uncharacterized protein VDAG_10235 [Verticillium dahliae VdLs.17]EGY20606.1 hypothetical protein VDAG_10235 [Verticillium dahliae VdLs.17]KAH6671644.1 hypothetical protein EV126DRAFT_435772 [Verticillium dahliae]KAH6694426.1 hypothetical protein EV126DRAFT_427780 [Verticillium dahliae]